MTNVLGNDKRQQIVAPGRLGWSLRRIEQATGVRRETISGYLKAAAIAVRGPERPTASTAKAAISPAAVSADLRRGKPAISGEVAPQSDGAKPAISWSVSTDPERPTRTRAECQRLTTTEILGFADAVIEFWTHRKLFLQAHGLSNVNGLITQLETLKEDAVTKNDEQEALKAQLRMKTDEVEAAFTALYNAASTKLDATIGVLGKTTELGKQAAHIRSDIRRGSNSPPEEPTEE